MRLDTAQFRQVMSQFATGVTIVTVRSDRKIHGMTVNSFCSVSLQPPLVLWCAENGSRTLQLIEQSRVYAVNVLAADQQHLSDHFAARLTEEGNRFAGVEFRDGPATGCPLLPGCLAWIECRLVEAVPAGDHTVLLAEPVALAQAPEGRRPLLFFASRYWDPGLPGAPRTRPDI